MMNGEFRIKILLLFLYLAASCTVKEEPDKGKEEIKTPVFPTPSFNADSSYYYIQQQLAFGPRVPNTPPNDSCGNFLIARLQGFAHSVRVQKARVDAYNGKKLNIRNIIGEFFPDKQVRILLCAHWDTRHVADHDTIDKDKPIPGASDGASGVAVLLEIARQMKIVPPPVGVDILLFDAEDYGSPDESLYAKRKETYCLGSQYWALHPHKPNYYARFGILLDMVGAKNAQFWQEGISLYYAPGVVEKVWSAASKLGYSDYFIFQGTHFLGADDHLYVNRDAKIPTIDIIDFDPGSPTGFPPYHHTHQDDIGIIDKNTLKAVGQTVLEVIYNER